MKRNDFILIGILAILGIGTFTFMQINKKEGAKVVVYVDGAVYKEVDLEKDTTFTIEDEDGHTNEIQVKDGKVTMIEASCPDQICVHQQAISFDKESIVCLPNHVVVTIESDESSEIDSVAN